MRRRDREAVCRRKRRFATAQDARDALEQMRPHADTPDSLGIYPCTLLMCPPGVIHFHLGNSDANLKRHRREMRRQAESEPR